MGILAETLDDIVAVEDEQIAEAIVLLAERTKLVVEGSRRRERSGDPSAVSAGGGP